MRRTFASTIGAVIGYGAILVLIGLSALAGDGAGPASGARRPLDQATVTATLAITATTAPTATGTLTPTATTTPPATAEPTLTPSATPRPTASIFTILLPPDVILDVVCSRGRLNATDREGERLSAWCSGTLLPTVTPWPTEIPVQIVTATPGPTGSSTPTATPAPTQTPWVVVVTITPEPSSTPTDTPEPTATETPDAIGTAVAGTLTAIAPPATGTPEPTPEARVRRLWLPWLGYWHPVPAPLRSRP